jgi:hypothetical protein
MDTTTPAVDAPLPNDVPTLQAMVRELLAKNQQLEARVAEQGKRTHLLRKSRRTCSRNASSQPALSRLFFWVLPRS